MKQYVTEHSEMSVVNVVHPCIYYYSFTLTELLFSRQGQTTGSQSPPQLTASSQSTHITAAIV